MMQVHGNNHSGIGPILKIVGFYALFGCLWIVLSDRIVGYLFKEPEKIILMGEYKGILFIILTSSLLFLLISKHVEETNQARETLRQANEELELRVVQRTEELQNRRQELEEHNRELQETYRRLEQETAERIQALEQLRQKEQMLIQQSRMAAMGEMLGNIAHQWRQPLNVLGLRLQQLGIYYEQGEFSRELLDSNIDKAMEIVLHLSQTINDFREFSRPDKEKKLFVVEDVIRKTISLIEDSFREQRIEVETIFSGNVRINGFENEYAQVILNILMNARDAFGERGIPEPCISIRSNSEDGRSVVCISDNAGGIAEDILGRVFDAYFTTKALGKGTGVGLFMSKTIIEANMGGSLTARNAGGGAEFRIVI